MLETLDAAAVRQWCAGALAALQRHRGEIDQLNVYPVPDGDTGTNLALTLASAHQAMTSEDTATDSPGGIALGVSGGGASEPFDGELPHGRLLHRMARGALLGARGNSGAIVSQFLRALAESLSAVEAVRGRAFSAALRSATTAAYAAVVEPVEGTVLTVLAAAAAGAEQADSDDLGVVVRAAAEAAATALARTPQQLPALAAAGVVDAGGRGLCVLLDALVAVVTGAPVPDQVPVPAAPGAPVAVRETGSPAYAYEVQYLLDADEAAVERLRERLSGLGDSLVVVGTGAPPDGTPTWNVHVHVNDIGAAVEAGVEAGRPYRISVTRFDDQIAQIAVAGPARAVWPAAIEPSPGPVDPQRRATVVVAAGSGLAEIFTAEGATVVAGNPSTGELLDAIRSTGAGQVVVLPNDPHTQAVAGEAADEARSYGVRASVVPTRSPVQALAALAVRDPTRRFDDDLIAMAEAAGACRYAEVSIASREALTVAGPCHPGDVLALVEGEVHLVGDDLVRTCRELLDRMLGGGGELVTLLVGADAPPDLAEALQEHLARRWPFVEVNCYVGGQPYYPLLVGVE